MIPEVETGVVLSIAGYYSILYARLNRGTGWRQRPRHPGSLASFRFVYPLIISAITVAAIASFWHFGPRLESSPALVVIGGVVALAGTVLFSKAVNALADSYSPCFDMRMPRNVVTTGPYRFVRHPIYVANALVGLGILLMSMSLVVAVSVAAVCVYYTLAAKSEERFCEQNVPGYLAYAARTGRVFPRLKTSA